MSILFNKWRNRAHSDAVTGFTLVELLVVIAIISILATLLLLQLGIARAKARDVKRIADVNQVRSALEQYYDQNGSYLANNDMSVLTPLYLINIPKDPLAGGTNTYDGVATGGARHYGYAWNALTSPTQYQLWTQLEQPNRNALQSAAHINSSAWAGGAAGVNNSSIVIPTTCTAGGLNCVFDLGQT